MTGTQATWVKLGIAVVATAVSLVIFKFTFAAAGGFFLTALGSLLTVVALSVAIYAPLTGLILRKLRAL